MSNLPLTHIMIACKLWLKSKPMPSHQITPEFIPDVGRPDNVCQSAMNPAPQPGNRDLSPDDVADTSEIDQILAQCESDSRRIHRSIDRIAKGLDELAAVRTEFDTCLRTQMISLQCQDASQMQELPLVNNDKKNELTSAAEVATRVFNETPDPVTTDTIEEKPKTDLDTGKEKPEDVSVPKSLAQLCTNALALQEAKDERMETRNAIQEDMKSSETQPLTKENLSLMPYQPQRPYTSVTENQPDIVHAAELGSEKKPDSVEVKNEPRTDDPEKTAEGTAIETALPPAEVTAIETALPPAEGTAIETAPPPAGGTAPETALPPSNEIEPDVSSQTTPNESPEGVELQKLIAFFDGLIKESKRPNQKSRAKYEKRMEKMVENEMRRLNKHKDGQFPSEKRPEKEENRIQKAIAKLEMIYESDRNHMDQILKGEREELDVLKNAVTMISDENRRNEIIETTRLKETALKIVVRDAECHIGVKQDMLARDKKLLLDSADSE
ncbi:hypothetical protein OUZ56_024764 [Daphnia magna]|uniref:Uncharacterized protein n=1 Tax=Daphnia magna TaxID=35525 RepID=A0ABQ9ZHX9_9CRUS|nr:hypothetical protein OUZ56_024764 [Daphnia magna]